MGKNHKINSNIDKKQDGVEQMQRKFQETKQTFIEFKVIKKKRSKLNREDENLNSKIL
jgi:predicted  nucleic acid-binding Zn-ribbon protein